ncbi:hypothetical protein [Synechococcus sp. CCY9202]|uniref:hypothetical protein n=1 Tax=Synechococcus sp. CCY9202 TaxID=174698 RepID=UPI002B1F1647|nr:hypothetical protein [Synechococcus sp. CCY9202]MEA5423148.1 hypothetical protein [Synechococcus sp. CCY9202]
MPQRSHAQTPTDPVEELRSAPDQQDADGEALWEPVAVDPTRPISQTNPPRRAPHHAQTPRATAGEVERRIAEAQLWIAQRLPLLEIRAKAGESWGVSNVKTINRYLDLARMRMVEELITDRRRHQAEQIFALNECARRAMDAEQFSAAVGAFRVIAEIGGLLRAPIKPPEPRV